MKKRLLSIFLILATTLSLIPVAYAAGPAEFKVILYPCATDATITGAAKGGMKTKTADPYYLYYTRAIGSDKATRPGYTFLGWYLAFSGGSKITNSTKISTNPGYAYAHWAKNLSALSFSGAGGTQRITIQGTGGHKWSVNSFTPTSMSINIVKVDDKTFDVKVGARNDSSYSTFSTTVTFKDSDGNPLTMKVSQSPNYSLLSSNIYQALDRNPVLFHNPVSSSQTGAPGTAPLLPYNMGYATWFISCCTDSAMMDLLNRRLAAERKLSPSYYFDVRDILGGISCDGNGKPKKYNASSVTVSDDTLHCPGWSGTYYELSYQPGNVSSTFINEFGSSGNRSQYKVSFQSLSGNAALTEIANLLKKHPEGVWVYFNPPSQGGNKHAVLITGYSAATDSFTFVDNGNTSYVGPGLFTTTCLYGKGYIDNNGNLLQDTGSAKILSNYIWRIAWISN